MVQWSVHSDQLSIFLIQSIIPFRLIEHQFGQIVNSIEGKAMKQQDLLSPQHFDGTAHPAYRAPPHTTGDSRPFWKENEMSILSSIGRIATEFKSARARYQTERALRSLPAELQKDIGWPEVSGNEPSSRSFSTRTGVGVWAGAK
jgi:hypothetical protein